MTTEEVEEHLRGASDAIMMLIGEVQQLEGHKRGLKPADPRFEELAREVRVAAQSLLDFAVKEEAWAVRPETSDAAVAPIAVTEAPPSLAAILSQWRVIERELQVAAPGTPEARRLFEEFERLRDEYLRVFSERDIDG